MSEDKPVVVFDALEYDNFELCMFRHHAFHDLNLRPKKKEIFFDKGSLLHFFMEKYYKIKQVEGNEGINQEVIDHLVELGRIESVKYELNLDEISSIIFQFREYARFYSDENIVPLHVEEPFALKFYEDDDIIIYIAGQPDLVFKYKNTNNIAVMDHKKVEREFPISPLRNQFHFYATAIGTDTVIVNKIGFQKSKKPNERFLRQVINYKKEVLDEWKKDVIFKAKEMILYQKAEHYPRNRTSCEKFNGCYLQRYCFSTPIARQLMIGTEYIIGESWDVGKKLEKE